MPLNEKLFTALERRFGQGRVQILREGAATQLSYQPDPLEADRWRVSVQTRGEEYQVRCPFCHDQKPRLSINNLWGAPDQQTGRKNLWLARCYNEECLTDTQLQWQLYEQVFQHFAIGDLQAFDIKPGRTHKAGPAKAPGVVWRLDLAATQRPNHPAVKYAEKRLHCPIRLGRDWKVGVLLTADRWELSGRLYVPVRTQGKLVTWQARVVGYAGDSPKWLNCPGAKKSDALYGHDVAGESPVKIVVEGPPAVWRLGRGAVGVLGKTISMQQADLLRKLVRPGDIVAVMLDPEQDPKMKARGRPHHIETAAERLEQEEELRGKVVRVYLPLGVDPDDVDRCYSLQLIREAAKEQGILYSNNYQ